MGITFHASGKLSDLLKKFKSEYLSQLTPENLGASVVLSVQVESLGSNQDDETLKEKLIKVIENE